MSFYEKLYNDLKKPKSKEKKKLVSVLRSIRHSLYKSDLPEKTKIEAIYILDALYLDYISKL